MHVNWEILTRSVHCSLHVRGFWIVVFHLDLAKSTADRASQRHTHLVSYASETFLLLVTSDALVAKTGKAWLSNAPQARDGRERAKLRSTPQRCVFCLRHSPITCPWIRPLQSQCSELCFWSLFSDTVWSSLWRGHRSSHILYPLVKTQGLAPVRMASVKNKEEKYWEGRGEIMTHTLSAGV